ncbi:MAG: hypothetical protein NXI00_23905 [Cytophagales bacterium]|nr:hypothetical protein [Cytophagales bacterium]
MDTITCLVEAGFDIVWSADRRGVLSVWSDKEKDGMELDAQFQAEKVKGHKRMRSKSCK